MYKLFKEFRSFVKEKTAAAKRGIILPDTLEQLREYVGDNYYVHFSDLNKLGINPSTTFNTPAGIYGYPLTEEIFFDLSKGELPFASDRKYIHVFEANNPAKVMTAAGQIGDESDISDEEYKSTLEKLQHDPIFSPLESHSKVFKSVREEGEVAYKQGWKDARGNVLMDDKVLNPMILDNFDPKLFASPRIDVIEFGFRAWRMIFGDDINYPTYKEKKLSWREIVNSKIAGHAMQKKFKEDMEKAKEKHGVEIKKIDSMWDLFSIEQTEQLSIVYEDNLLKVNKAKNVIGDAERDARFSSNFGKLWNVTRVFSGQNSKIWAYMLRRLGWHGVVDFGEGLIHENEESQVVFFSKGYVTHLATIVNKQRPDDIKRRQEIVIKNLDRIDKDFKARRKSKTTSFATNTYSDFVTSEGEISVPFVFASSVDYRKRPWQENISHIVKFIMKEYDKDDNFSNIYPRLVGNDVGNDFVVRIGIVFKDIKKGLTERIKKNGDIILNLEQKRKEISQKIVAELGEQKQNPINEDFEDVGYNDDGKHWGNAGSGILFHTDNKMFLLLRSGEVQEPGTHGIPGGAIPEDDETGKMKDPWLSAKTETKEECGSLPPGFNKYYQKLENQVSEDFLFTTYIVKLPNEAEENWHPRLDWENDDYGWYSLHELPDRLHPGVSWALKQMK